MQENSNGIHLILDIIVKDIKYPDLNSENVIKEYIKNCVILSEMECLSDIVMHKLPYNEELCGITAFVPLSTSHLAVHSWPEYSYISIDLFSCKYFDIDEIIDFTKEYFNTKRVDISIINRDIGIPHKYANFVEEN